MPSIFGVALYLIGITSSSKLGFVVSNWELKRWDLFNAAAGHTDGSVDSKVVSTTSYTVESGNIARQFMLHNLNSEPVWAVSLIISFNICDTRGFSFA